MCDDPAGFRERHLSAAGAETLQLIARTLGVPVTSFNGARDGAGGDLAAAEADHLLGLVRAHFARVPLAERRAFADAVQRMAVEA